MYLSKQAQENKNLIAFKYILYRIEKTEHQLRNEVSNYKSNTDHAVQFLSKTSNGQGFSTM